MNRPPKRGQKEFKITKYLEYFMYFMFGVLLAMICIGGLPLMIGLSEVLF